LDRAETFFAELSERGHEPLLRRMIGSVRFDLDTDERTDRWLVTLSKGSISVAPRNGEADAVIHTDRRLFNRFLTGEANPMASMLCGLMRVEGEPRLGVLSRRLYATADGDQTTPPSRAREEEEVRHA
jgi:putative sterol carrier protein